ncbi:MAG: AMP-binding protein [Gammaproteobacteria bacterium]|nr:AMP-binding protein [Gammaproteobacteria bacterium]
MPNRLYSLVTRPETFPPEQVVAINASGSILWADVLEKASSWRDRLCTVAGRYIAVQLPDGDDYLACLLAIWQQQKVAVLCASEFGQVIRSAELHPIQIEHTTSKQRLQEEVFELRQFYVDIGGNDRIDGDEKDVAVVLFTSGSSGTPVAITKTFTQLSEELQLLESLWGEKVSNSVFCSTVSRQHMYGLPFGLLWPLVYARPFYAETIHYIQTLENLAIRFPFTLITSPVQLQNLPDNLDWDLLRSRVVAIFSAGAVLPQSAARRCERLLSTVTEIYGSTETGAVAWREQPADAHWQCLPGVAVATAPGSRQLQISSPCLPVTAEQTIEMADLATIISATRFDLLGRSDRIVKVGGKRISLTQVESHLLSHDWVDDVKTVLLEQRKSRVGAAVVLTQEGRNLLIDRGRLFVNRVLADHIALHIEPVARPRYWRYIGRIPVDGQGKSGAPLLTALFCDEQQPRMPEVLERQYQAGSSKGQLTLRIPDTLYYFNGHFPGNPVLPGVVQVDWAIKFSAELFGESGKFLRLDRLKFQHIVQPGDIVTLSLALDVVKSRIHFAYSTAKLVHSSGQVVFEH